MPVHRELRNLYQSTDLMDGAKSAVLGVLFASPYSGRSQISLLSLVKSWRINKIGNYCVLISTSCDDLIRG